MTWRNAEDTSHVLQANTTDFGKSFFYLIYMVQCKKTRNPVVFFTIFYKNFDNLAHANVPAYKGNTEDTSLVLQENTTDFANSFFYII